MYDCLSRCRKSFWVNHSFDMHVTCLELVSCFSPSWIYSECTPRVAAMLMAWWVQDPVYWYDRQHSLSIPPKLERPYVGTLVQTHSRASGAWVTSLPADERAILRGYRLCRLDSSLCLDLTADLRETPCERWQLNSSEFLT